MENQTWRFVLDLDPMPAPRPRARAIISHGRPIATVYNPAEYKHWLEDANEQLIQQIHGETLVGDLSLSITVTVQKPKTSKLRRPKPDVDNYAKAVMDAMTHAGVWIDDAQVGDLRVRKQWGGIGRIDIEVARVAAGD